LNVMLRARVVERYFILGKGAETNLGAGSFYIC
jgi:hypothetical protein